MGRGCLRMKIYCKLVYLMMKLSKRPWKLFKNKDWRMDMMIKLYAIEIFEGNIKYKDLPFSDTIKNKIKAYLTKMVEDEEILAE
ncbi:CD1375 family protein, partial [Streptococcus suis]